MLDPALLDPERVRPLLRHEYQQLIDAGRFDDERVELLRGVLVEMSPQGVPHARITAWFAQHLIKALDIARIDVRSHSPFAASIDSMPEPDVSVSLRSDADQHPTQALLLIEVSDSSLRKDRIIKTEIYAEAGVPEYWIVDVEHQAIEILTQPTKTGYANTKRIESGVLRPLHLPIELPFEAIPWRARATE